MNFTFIQAFKPYAHKRCVLRHCTSIVYILASYKFLVVFITVLFTLKHLIFPALIYVHNARMYSDNFNPYHSIILFYTFIYIYIYLLWNYPFTSGAPTTRVSKTDMKLIYRSHSYTILNVIDNLTYILHNNVLELYKVDSRLKWVREFRITGGKW